MKKYRFTAVFEPQEEGGFTVTVPALPGCISEGDTFEEAQVNIREAVESYLGSLVREGEAVPETRSAAEVISLIQILFDPKKLNQSTQSSLHV